MKPYFQEGDITLYNGECLNVLSKISISKNTLLFTDPPYGIKESAGKNKSRGLKAISKDYGNKDWDNSPPPPEYFKYVLKHTKDQIIFGGNYFIDYLYNTPCFIIWDKNNGKTDFADCELAWTSFETATRKFEWTWQGMLQQDMGNKKEIRIHPTQKPVGLAKLILKAYFGRSKYDCVLDTHSGSGSFGVACKELKIPYIGIDQDKEYCEGAKFRLQSLKGIIKEDRKEKAGLFF